MSATDDLTLNLAWRHGRGGFGPFFAALEQGRILGSNCPACGRTVTPPRDRCVADGRQMVTRDLPPSGTVLQVTTGAASSLLASRSEEETFALVQVTGSDNSLLVRIAECDPPVQVGARVKLASVAGPVSHPAQRLVFVTET
jgi:uncharacterized OB-fold protein